MISTEDYLGADPSFPSFAFVFLVALGIDYNIFLMTRVREETRRHGTRRGTLKGLAVRSLLVPALVHELDDLVWWPGSPGRRTSD